MGSDERQHTVQEGPIQLEIKTLKCVRGFGPDAINPHVLSYFERGDSAVRQKQDPIMYHVSCGLDRGRSSDLDVVYGRSLTGLGEMFCEGFIALYGDGTHNPGVRIAALLLSKRQSLVKGKTPHFELLEFGHHHGHLPEQERVFLLLDLIPVLLSEEPALQVVLL